MEFYLISYYLHTALELLLSQDSFLILNNVNERSISHRLACYLTELFPDYDVDCEYDSNVQADREKKFSRLHPGLLDLTQLELRQ